MKKYFTFLVPAIGAVIILSSYSGNLSMYPQGAPSGYTGSPLDGKNCTQCHGGNAANVIGWITSDVPVEGYIPGQTYNITVTVSGSGAKGFEVSPQNPSGSFLGTLHAGTGSKLTSGNANYITHSSSSNANPKVWTFTWTAPAAGSGAVTMYGAFALNKSATKLSILVIPENTTTGIPENQSQVKLNVYPNPVGETLFLNIKLENQQQGSVSLVSASGSGQYELFNGSIAAGEQKLCFNVSNIPSGIYLLEFSSKEGQSGTKVIIRH